MSATRVTPAAATRRRRLALRLLLGWLAALAALPGAWATIAPRSFYRSFPGHWHLVELLPPFNAHLIADVGAFYLAFALMLAWAAASLQRSLVQAVCVAWGLFSVLHQAWHAAHLARFGVGAAVAQTVSLAVVLILPGVALELERRSRHRGP